ncbi:MAG: hypothetical protein DME04_12820 [Candidatus Rokuibacteriota bacterium]|nr:MAG: hypothetical protein DME04_12820 [Candidatus Rokubacteria bacterium]
MGRSAAQSLETGATWHATAICPPRFFGGQRQRLSDSAEDKGNADTIMGMEDGAVRRKILGQLRAPLQHRTPAAAMTKDANRVSAALD